MFSKQHNLAILKAKQYPHVPMIINNRAIISDKWIVFEFGPVIMILKP